jgi:elongator complex protein 4
VFCHAYTLTTHLESSDVKGQLHDNQLSPPFELALRSAATASPFGMFLKSVRTQLESSSPTEIHRICVPGILSPSLYSSAVCHPSEILQFLHGLRSLLRQFPTRLSAVLTLPTSLYPRTTGIVRWMELLCDGVVEIIPLQESSATPTQAKGDDAIQGFFRIHSLPVHHEKGGGSESFHSRENLSFRLSVSSGLVIKPYSLPPVGELTNPKSETRQATTSPLEF